jgi:ubiquinol-cytochrome c reductase cytochrome c1 subunit
MKTLHASFRTLAFALAAGLAALAAAPAATAAGGPPVNLDKWPVTRMQDLAALQNGAKVFANYCLGCHGASHMRWNRLQEIGLTDRQIKEYLIFGTQRVGDMMTTAMAPRDALRFFGKVPPDLSVIVRARTSFDYKGADYLYTLLRGYYRDASSPTGWNNIVYPSIGMPHIMWERQGPREASIERIFHTVDDKKGETRYFREVSTYDAGGNVSVARSELKAPAEDRMAVTFKPQDAAAARQYDSDVGDLVAFLNFVTDPSADDRVSYGVGVLLFMVLFTFVAWRMSALYWKDVK